MASFAKKAAVIGAAFLAARVGVRKFTEAFQKLDTLGKLSDAMQVSPDFLQGLDLAATQTGSSFATAQKALGKFVRSIGEAKSGTGEGIQGLEILGVQLKDIENLSTEDQFFKIANAIKNMEDPSLKAAAAAKLFGRSGQDLINLFNQGEVGLRSFIAAQKELSGGISRDDIAQVEAANDAIDKMGRAWDGIFQQLTILLAPAVKAIADIITKGIQIVKRFAKAFEFLQLSDIFAELSVQFAKVFGTMEEHINILIGLVEKFGKVWRSIQKDIEGIVSKLFFGGKGIDIELGPATSGPFGKGKGDEEKKIEPLSIAAASIKSFSEAARAGSSKAFDLLNPNTSNSVANQTLKATETTNDLLREGLDKESINFNQVNI